MGRSGWPWLAGALLLAMLPACTSDDDSPERTVKAFLEAVAAVEPDSAYQLLAPETQQDLRKQADLATRHTGGRHQLLPKDMLLLSLSQPLHEVDKITLLDRTDTRARVRLSSGGKAPVNEEIMLVKDSGRWRILLNLGRPKAAPSTETESAATGGAAPAAGTAAPATSEHVPAPVGE